MRKRYQGTITFDEGIQTGLRWSVCRLLNTFGSVRKKIRGEQSTIPQGTMTYREACLTLPLIISPTELDKLVSETLTYCNVVGVEYRIDKRQRYFITLKNTLVGDRVNYYTVDIKDNNYHIRTVTVDLDAGKELIYGINMYATKAAASAAAQRAMAALSAVN